MLYERNRTLLLSESSLKGYFEKDLLIISINLYNNLLNHFVFLYFLLIGNDQQGALRKEQVKATFIEWFKIATLRKSY